MREAIDCQLVRGETITWLEQPVPRLFKRRSVWLAVVSGLPVAVGSVYGFVAGARGELYLGGKVLAPELAMAVMSAGILGGLVDLTIPLRLRRIARNTAYVITNRRVLVVHRSYFCKIDSEAVIPEALDLLVKPSSDGVSGEIALVARGKVNKDREDMVQLFALRDVRATEAALGRLIQSSSKSSL